MHSNIRCGLVFVALTTVTIIRGDDPLFTCNFETEDLCGMEHWTKSQFDWTRHSGRTPTDVNGEPTGPREAQYGTYYIYIETSSLPQRVYRAFISTPAVQHSGDICVRFYYSMYGRDIGRLVVFTERQNESSPVFEKEGEQGYAWKYGEVTVKDFTDNDKVVFLGIVANGHRGDIAIDYLRIHAGSCSPCQLHNGGCDTFCATLTDYPYARCECHHGYSISDDPYTCVDIDECQEGNGGCSDTCRNNPGSYACQCLMGYSLATDNRTCEGCQVRNGGCDTFCVTLADYPYARCECHHGYSISDDPYTCVDIDECQEGNGGCSDTCRNTPGSYECQCPMGYSLATDNRTCEDIDECATDAGNECDHVCINVEGRYNSSCRDTYIRATDGRHCIECDSAYKKKVETSQLFTSDCPTTSSHAGITLTDCLLKACSAQAGVLTYLNRVCHLKLCQQGDLRLNISPGNSGWDIYELDTRWSEATREGDQGNTGDHFPLVAVIVGVLVPVILLFVIVTTVVLLKRRRPRKEGRESVHYENDNEHTVTEREHDLTPPPVIEAQFTAGIYEEILEPDNKHQDPNETYDDVSGDPVSRIPQVKEAAINDASELHTYKNAAFQGDCRYQCLGPDGNPRYYDVVE